MEKLRQVYLGATVCTAAGLAATFMAKLLYCILDRKFPFLLSIFRFSPATFVPALIGTALLVGGAGLFTAMIVMQKKMERKAVAVGSH
jgi:hypothetical protein